MVMWVCRGGAVCHGDVWCGCAGAEEQIVNEQAVVMVMCGVGVQGLKSRL